MCILVQTSLPPIILGNNPFIIKEGEMFKFKPYPVITHEESSFRLVTADDFSLEMSSSPPSCSRRNPEAPCLSLSDT